MNRHATILLGILWISVPFANAATRNVPQLTIKVFSAETESTPFIVNNGAPLNCNLGDYDAHCRHSRTTIVRHTMVVRDSNGKTYTIGCTVDTMWSKCVSLPVGGVFTAERTKRGIRVWYPNAKGKEVKQTYALVPADEERSSASPSEGESLAATPANNDTSATAPSPQSSAAVRFTSTPAGAAITLDGDYVGNTPSTITVGSGKHLVVLAMPGFSEWKQALTVSSGSDVTLTATLQKTN